MLRFCKYIFVFHIGVWTVSCNLWKHVTKYNVITIISGVMYATIANTLLEMLQRRWGRTFNTVLLQFIFIRQMAQLITFALLLANVNIYVTFAICYRRSVCLSSVTLVHPTQAVELFGNFFFHHTIAQGLYFSGAKNRWWRRPFPPEICVQSDPLLSNSEISTNIGS